MRVLLIDDQPEVLEPLAEYLSTVEGIDGKPYEATRETSHEKALKRVEKERFEVVVVDMFTPERSDEGLDVVRELTTKSPVTIVFTAHPTFPNCVASLHAGAWDYIEKNPYDGSDAYDNLVRSIEEGCRERLAHPDLGRPSPNAKWVSEHFRELAEKYPGRVVAVFDEKVVDCGATFGEVWDRVESQFPFVKPYVVGIPDPREETVG